MERAAEASGGSSAPQLQFHNLVNNADVVPRLLGTSLEALHELLETYVPMIQVSGSGLARQPVLSLPWCMTFMHTGRTSLCGSHESCDIFPYTMSGPRFLHQLEG